MKTAQFGKVIRRSDVCVLCGERPANTKEHIPPRGLFIELPKDYLTVPACSDCNGSSKLEDEYLRHFVSGAMTPEGERVWVEKVRPRLHERPATRAGLVRILGKLNVVIPKVGSVQLPALFADADRIRVSIRKMVRGLYWFHTDKILPADVRIRTKMMNIVDLSRHFGDAEEMPFFRATVLGVYQDPEVMKTFFYQALIDPVRDGDPAPSDRSIWYFFFYRQNALIALTGEDDDAQDVRETSTAA